MQKAALLLLAAASLLTLAECLSVKLDYLLTFDGSGAHWERNLQL
jgi:hypothetical protein